MSAPVAIAIEEHFQTRELSATFRGLDILKVPRWQERLFDVGALRLREMEEAGIAMQVVSHVAPGTQKLEPETAVRLARHANDQLQALIAAHPGRFAGYAELPTPDPRAAADELERTVTAYGFKGARINGLTHGLFMDDKRFWVIFERAHRLGVPVYIHPSTPHPAVIEAHYRDYPVLAHAGWGFGVEAATHAVRLILSGLFDTYPNLRIILGHLGESLPFWLWRCDRVLSRDAGIKKRFRDYFREHFVVTTSGNFSPSALQCCLAEVGIDNILFAVDWPMQSNREAREFIEAAPLGAEDKEKILHRNAKRVLGL